MRRVFRIGPWAVATCILASCAAVEAPEESSGSGHAGLTEYSPDQRYIVRLRNPAARAAVASAGTVALDLPSIGAVAAYLPDAAVDALRRNPSIEYVEVDPRREVKTEVSPWGIAAVQADQLPEGISPVKVCIIDSGYDGAHEDLAHGGHVTGGGAANPFDDTCGHGTHVAGTIAAVGNNALGVVGVNANGELPIHVVKVFDGADCGWAYSSDLVGALAECEAAGARVINMSLGCASQLTKGPRACYSRAEDEAFAAAYANGVLSIAAASNDGNDWKSYPAALSSVVAVAAVDDSLSRADFSNYYPEVELAAPGVGVLSTEPTGTGSAGSVATSSEVYEAIPMENAADGTGTGPMVDCGLGTSTCPGGGGQVCLIQRGDISFADKVAACEAGGGAAAIIYNNTTGALSGTLGESTSTIPAVGVTADVGASLSAQLGDTTTVQTASGGNYGYKDGTSMATPHVAGVAALVWGHFPELTNQDIRDALAATALDLGAAGRDAETGYGLVQAHAAFTYLGGSLGCSVDGDCDDGDACTGTETCVDGACVAGTPVSCGDGDACNGTETCDPATGACVAGTPLSCDDGDACTGTETCDPASGCVAGAPVECATDGNLCTVEMCDPTTGSCGTAPLSCDDGDPCTNDGCDAGSGCTNVFDDTIPGCTACAPLDGACTSDADCCSGKCKGRPGSQTCR